MTTASLSSPHILSENRTMFQCSSSVSDSNQDFPSFSDWENLPKHLLDSVAEKLPKPSDYLGFSLVCKSWYSVAKDNSIKHASMTAPMLLFNSGKKDYCNFYDLISQKVLNFQVNVPRTRLVGSSKGWLIFTEKNTVDRTFSVTLVNPLFRIIGREDKANSLIRLPPLTPRGWKKWYKNSRRYVRKATISADPILHPNDCIVTVIHLERGRSAFINLGKDTKWTYVYEKVDDALLGFHMIEEVASLGNKFYAVNCWSEVLSFDVAAGCSSSNTKLVGRGCDPGEYDIKRYIFEGEKNTLWMVQRYLKFGSSKRVTKKFRVFELNFQGAEWTEKNTLDDAALFVGENSSVRVLPAEVVGFESNCIYFNHDFDYLGTDDYRACDFGVYSVEDQCFRNIYTESTNKLLEMSYPMPIWVVPTLSFPL